MLKLNGWNLNEHSNEQLNFTFSSSKDSFPSQGFQWTLYLCFRRGAWIAEWSSHLTTMNIGMLRPGP